MTCTTTRPAAPIADATMLLRYTTDGTNLRECDRNEPMVVRWDNYHAMLGAAKSLIPEVTHRIELDVLLLDDGGLPIEFVTIATIVSDGEAKAYAQLKAIQDHGEYITAEDAKRCFHLMQEYPALWEQFCIAKELYDDDCSHCTACGQQDAEYPCQRCGSTSIRNDLTTYRPQDEDEMWLEDCESGDWFDDDCLYGIW